MSWAARVGEKRIWAYRGWTKSAGWAALLGVMAFCPPTMAADSSLTLVMGGEAYDGPPEFEVIFDGQVLGTGAVAAAIDTANVGRFADAADKMAYVQSFEFRIPEAAFKPDGAVRVRFTNEAYGGVGSNRDRNLYLASVAVNGRAVTASGFTSIAAKGVDANALAPNVLLGEFLVLADGTVDGVSAAPQGGWPAAPEVVADAAPAIDPVIISSARAGAAPAAKVTPPAVAETAGANPDPEGNGTACGIDQVYNVVGFNENSNELTPRLIERLDQVAADIGERQCNVQITGYSSRQGSFATNALFAIERAQNSLRYLREKGVKFVRASATGVGATDQFGPAFGANRRVVIIVTP